MRIRAIFLLVLIIFGFVQLHAQSDIKHAVIPAIGYSSDNSFVAGGTWQMVSYIDDTSDTRPYIFLNRIQPEISILGSIALKNVHERWLSNGDRIWSELLLMNVSNTLYFGIGNDSNFDSTLWDDNYYNYGRWYISNQILYGLELNNKTSYRSELILGITSIYQHARIPEESFITEFPPNNITGGIYNRAIVGLIFDNRNNLFRPVSGLHSDVRIGLVPNFFNQNNIGLYIQGTISTYKEFDIFLPLVLATRLKYEQVTSTTAYYALPSLGGPDTIRGFPFERFRDNGYVLANIELRTWLFSLPFWEIEVGGQFFADAGRVFEKPGIDALTENYKMSWGIGGIMAILNPDFLVRGDLGFSNEMFRINVGVGYLF